MACLPMIHKVPSGLKGGKKKKKQTPQKRKKGNRCGKCAGATKPDDLTLLQSVVDDLRKDCPRTHNAGSCHTNTETAILHCTRYSYEQALGDESAKKEAVRRTNTFSEIPPTNRKIIGRKAFSAHRDSSIQSSIRLLKNFLKRPNTPPTSITLMPEGELENCVSS